MSNTSTSDSGILTGEHYLERDFYVRLREDPMVFGFLRVSSLDGLWYRDLEKPENEWINPGLKKLLGYDDHEVPHTSAWLREKIHPDDLGGMDESFKAHLQDPGVPCEGIVRYRHKEGRTVWVRYRGWALRDGAGVPVRMLGVHHDVTALKEAEQLALRREARLREMHARYEAAQEASIDAQVNFDVVLDEGRPVDFIYRSVNPAACRLLRRSHDELAGHGIRSVFPTIADSEIFRRFVSAYTTGRPEEFETAFELDGREEWFRITAVRFGDRGLANSFEVISERKRRELQLKESNEALRRFAGIVSHDLQAPLRHISIFADLIKQSLDSDHDPSQFIGQIKSNAARMQGLIRSMLDYSIVAYSRIAAAEVSLQEIVHEARNLLQTDLEQHLVSFDIGPLPTVWGDRELLIRVFQNLFSNSLRRAKTNNLKISISASGKDANVTVRVADNGVGVPGHHAERIFEIGQQGVTTLPVVDKGAGIGLSICKAVIVSHGGQLWLVSEPGEGAVFYFTLPVKQERISPSS